MILKNILNRILKLYRYKFVAGYVCGGIVPLVCVTGAGATLVRIY